MRNNRNKLWHGYKQGVLSELKVKNIKYNFKFKCHEWNILKI